MKIVVDMNDLITREYIVSFHPNVGEENFESNLDKVLAEIKDVVVKELIK